MKKFAKIALVVASFVLVIALSVGGTIAWLTAKTDVVTNTFSPTNIQITLDEADVYEKGETGTTDETLGTKIPNASRVTANKYETIPGKTYAKDPTVTVGDTSEDCYLFVKFEETGDPATYYTYTSTLTVANGWTQGDGTNIPANVWYRIVKTEDDTRSWLLLADEQISVKDSVTKDNMTAAAAAKLEWKAYAIQVVGFENNAAGAWTEVIKLDNTSNG